MFLSAPTRAGLLNYSFRRAPEEPVRNHQLMSETDTETETSINQRDETFVKQELE